MLRFDSFGARMKDPHLTKDTYLVWSNENGGWLGRSGVGCVSNIEDAGQFSHARALEICANAEPGPRSSERLLDLPVRYSDATFVLFRQSRFGNGKNSLATRVRGADDTQSI